MANKKELQTRIALKYDNYSAWNTAPGKDLVLLPGEIGICEFTPEGSPIPKALLKVGNGEKKFHELDWLYANAADVYDWAKAKTAIYDDINKKIVFQNSENQEIYSISLASLATVEITNDHEARIVAIESSLSGSGSIAETFKGITDRLDTIEGDGEGSIAKAVADTLNTAQEYADSAAESALEGAKDYTDTEVEKDRQRLTALEEADETQDASIAENQKAIEEEVDAREQAIANLDSAYKAADQAIEAKIGGSYTSEATIHAAILDAKKAGTDAQEAITTLTNGKVAENTTKIGENAADIADIKKDLADEIKAREDADADITTRLTEVETFFKTTEDQTINDALDTLVEIQQYITADDGGVADQLLKDVQENKQAIADIKNIVEEGGSLEIRVDEAEADIADVEEALLGLKNVTEGFTGTGAIQTAVNGAYTKASEAAIAAAGAKTAADAAKTAADAAQDDINALELVINDSNTGLAKTKEIADEALSATADLDDRLDIVEPKVEELEGIVSTSENSNAALRADIVSLQALTNDTNKGNEKLYTDLVALSAVINDSSNGLAKTHEIATSAVDTAALNTTRIAAIEADYLKASDEYILNCGTAITINHEVPTEPEGTETLDNPEN